MECWHLFHIWREPSVSQLSRGCYIVQPSKCTTLDISFPPFRNLPMSHVLLQSQSALKGKLPNITLTWILGLSFQHTSLKTYSGTAHGLAKSFPFCYFFRPSKAKPDLRYQAPTEINNVYFKAIIYCTYNLATFLKTKTDLHSNEIDTSFFT